MVLVFLASCNNPVLLDSKKLSEEKTASEIFEIMDTASNDFYTSILEKSKSKAINKDDGQSEMEVAKIKSIMAALAIESSDLTDTSKLDTYLKEEGLYDLYMQIAEKYDLVNLSKSLSSSKSKSTSEKKDEWMGLAKTGDIVTSVNYSSTGSSSGSGSILGIAIPGKWKHAAIWNKAAGKAHSSSNETEEAWAARTEITWPDGSKTVTNIPALVGFENAANWRSKELMAFWRPNAHDEARAENAVRWAATQHGKPYGIAPAANDRNDESNYYCSKLAWMAWLKQGVNLEVDHTINRVVMVWFYGLFGTPLFQYPQYQISLDNHVTPQDLTQDGQTHLVFGD